MSDSKISFDSICAGTVDFDAAKVHTLPIHPNSSFVFSSMEEAIEIFSGNSSGYVYSRYANPTTRAVAKKLARLESYPNDNMAEAYLCSSGMSAIHTMILSLCKSGDRVLLSQDLYGGTIELFVKVLSTLQIEHDFVNLQDLDQLTLQAEGNSYKALFFETPTNPLLYCYPLDRIVEICRNTGIKTVIDNTFCTAYLQQPLLKGVDFVVYSATKYLAGHGNCTAGAVIGRDIEFMRGKFWTTLKLTGGICSPFEAWNLNNGLKTLSLRMDRHCSNAMKLAKFLEEQPKIKTVNYPGLESSPHYNIAKEQMAQFGGMLSFELDAEMESVMKFMNNLNLISNAPTLGDVDSLLLHPYTSSHINIDEAIRRKFGITPQLIRISVGIESIEDIIADVEASLRLI